MKKKINYKKILQIAGYIIAAVSVVYIIWVGYKQWQNIKGLFNFSKNWPIILISILVYAILKSLILTSVWKTLVSGFGGKITFKESFVVLGRSQVAKYIPGNVFQYLGKHILCKDLGISNGVIINGLFIETILYILSALIIFFLSAIIYGYKSFVFKGINNFFTLIAIVLGVIIILVIIIYLLIKFIPGIKEKLIKHNLIVNLGTLNIKKLWLQWVGGLVLCIAFFISTGLIMWYLNNFLWGKGTGSLLFFIGAYSIAWVVGFITPGASGGIGVREAVLVALLAPLTSQANALVLAIILRLITILVDLLLFALTYLFRKRKECKVVDPV
jgi:glycosyltransferase 2 family protein